MSSQKNTPVRSRKKANKVSVSSSDEDEEPVEKPLKSKKAPVRKRGNVEKVTVEESSSEETVPEKISPPARSRRTRKPVVQKKIRPVSEDEESEDSSEKEEKISKTYNRGSEKVTTKTSDKSAEKTSDKSTPKVSEKADDKPLSDKSPEEIALEKKKKEKKRKAEEKKLKEENRKLRIQIFDREVRTLSYECMQALGCLSKRTTTSTEKDKNTPKIKLEKFKSIYVKSLPEEHIDMFKMKLVEYRDEILNREDWIPKNKVKFCILDEKGNDIENYSIDLCYFYKISQTNAVYFEKKYKGEDEGVRKNCPDLNRDQKISLHCLRIFHQIAEELSDVETASLLLIQIHELEEIFGLAPSQLRAKLGPSAGDNSGLMDMIQDMMGGAEIPEGISANSQELMGAIGGIMKGEKTKEFMSELFGDLREGVDDPKALLKKTLAKFENSGIIDAIEENAAKKDEGKGKEKELSPEEELAEALSDEESE